MTTRNTILNELRESSPKLALQDPFRIPYQVPQGYFETLPSLLLDLVKGSVAELPVTGMPSFEVPQGYFDQFAESMLRKVKALDTAEPAEEMETLSPLLSQLSRKSPYSVPAGYFEELPANITDGAKAIELVNEELENLSPLMCELKEVNVYTVPAGYFDTLPAVLLQKATAPATARVVSISFTRKVFRYAAAAAVAGLIFLGGWQLLNNKPVSNTGVGPVADNNNKLIPSNISDTELLQFIETESSGGSVPAESDNEEIKAEDMKALLADISDDELQKYVEQANGSSTTIIN